MTGARVGDKATVLVVEDSEYAREPIVLLLGSYGFTVLTTRDGREAVRLLGQTDRVDVLLTDVVMPGGMGGREVAEEARRRHAAIKVVMFSGYPRDDLVAAGRIDEDTPLLSKPVPARRLVRAIENSLAEAGSGGATRSRRARSRS